MYPIDTYSEILRNSRIPCNATFSLGWTTQSCFSRVSAQPRHLITEVIDDLNGDSVEFQLVEGTRGVAVERHPNIFVDFGLEDGFQGLVGVVG